MSEFGQRLFGSQTIKADPKHNSFSSASKYSTSDLNILDTSLIIFSVPPVMFSELGVVDAPPESNGVNLLQYRNETAVLGPWDGKVAAHVWVSNNRCFITTNANYVAAPASAVPDKLFLRRDMRWGPDDPTPWPLAYSDYFSHFGAIRRRPSTAEAAGTSWILWWDPTHTHFISPASGQTLTRGLGKLSSARFSVLSDLSNDLLQKSDDYLKSSDLPLALVKELAESLRRGLSRLSSIPATFERMVLGVTNVQRTYLELEGLLLYMTVYKPRMENLDCEGGPPDTDTVGVFTADPTVAEKFHRARLPFWFIRPIAAFHRVNILRVVQPLDPVGLIELEVVEGFAPITVGLTLQERIFGLHRGTDTLPWYKDPFAPGDTAKPLSSKRGVISAVAGGSSLHRGTDTTSTNSLASSDAAKSLVVRSKQGPSGGSTNKGKSRNDPYDRQGRKLPNPNAQQERNKYEVFQSPYMAPSIPGWAAALAAVDRSQTPTCGSDPRNIYVLPEPALLVSSEARLQTYLHHYQLMRDALMFRMGNAEDHHTALTVSEWRDVLQGKLTKQGKRGSLAEMRTATIERVLGPALRECGIYGLHGIPVPADGVPPTTRTRGQELTWEVAEMNFRFELCSLDTLASGLSRLEKCMKCFPGPLIGPDLSEGRKGFAAIASSEHLPYLLSLAHLMRDWSYPPRPESVEVGEVNETTSWGPDQITDFERQVAGYYAQAFYHFFGRAAVIPMRLEHKLGTHPVELPPV
ncbi:hypothetical protein B0H16DRAFT_1741780 [Mycena metata]|uniref:Uncharacterized protein n=1 Tax=Mycena metata TaxID=1033252 RepID=A0AAD7MFY6_9AGAR|nr:hypothetical protein B0H16DRAFT_1741780 [Mycena metata]